MSFGFRDPSSSQEAMSFLNMVFTKLDNMLDCRKYSVAIIVNYSRTSVARTLIAH